MILKLVLYAVLLLVILAGVIAAIGYALPQNHVATVEENIQGAPADVFLRISDVGRYPEWRHDVSKVELLSSQPLKWREHTGGDVITYQVVESRPSERFQVRIADPALPFGGSWTYELRAEASGTHVAITERGEVYNPIFRFMSRFVLSRTATMDKFMTALRQAGAMPVDGAKNKI